VRQRGLVLAAHRGPSVDLVAERSNGIAAVVAVTGPAAVGVRDRSTDRIRA
jgi:hypothetical protein